MARANSPKVRAYRVELVVDFAARSFTGHVEADLERTDEPVVLNATELAISEVAVDGRAVPYLERPGEQELEVPAVPPGPCTVRVGFSGRATETNLIGLYVSHFGAEHILTTQCAPTGTRQIFPCIDRPDRKAPIELTLEIPEGLVAISNTAIAEERTEAGRRRLRFHPTPPMATYLFYLGIGRFEVLKGPAGRVAIDVFAPPGRSAAGAEALGYAVRLLPAFEEYFGIPYPLPKLDLIAVPQYAYGAMENWGAIVFRDMYLLFDGATSTRIRRYGLDTVAHEIAHQWFGNLVTMTWWDDIWLNESFATFLEMRLFERLEPSYRSRENYLAYWVPRALLGDALPHTHPVTTRIDDPSQIAQVFDEISYGKGSAILRMIEAYLGEEGFRKGVATFLDRFRYGNATSRDLWDALDPQGPEPVRPLLETWTERPGHPLLTVTRDAEGLLLRQQRFALDGQHRAESWPIPLTYEVDGKLHRTQLREPTGRLALPPAASFHLNPGGVGFYRVRYDAATYDRLLAEGRARSDVDRWTVLQDLESFLYSGDSSFERFAAFVANEADARDHLPVRLIAEALLEHWFVLGDRDPTRDAGLAFLRRQMERLGPARRPDERDTDGILRERVSTALAWMDPGFARELAERSREIDRVDANLRNAVLLATARTGDARTYEGLLERLGRTAAEGSSLDYEVALASFADPALSARTLELLTARRLNRAHLPEIVRRTAVNPDGRAPLWRWMRSALPAIAEETRGTRFAAYALEYAIPYVGLAYYDELTAWLAEHPLAEGTLGERKGRGILGANRALAARVSADGAR